jgi:hypothetical protein
MPLVNRIITAGEFRQPSLKREQRVRRVDETFAFTIHVETPNPLNGSHGRHWAVTARRKKQRKAVAEALLVYQDRRPRLPAIVTIFRSSYRCMDSDGLAAALKSVKDEIADWLLVDDGDEASVKFDLAQVHGPYAVRVEIKPKTSAVVHRR